MTMEDNSRENNQNNPVNEPRYKKKAPTRGGKRPGSGRKKGSTNKITAQEFFYDYRKRTGDDYVSKMIDRVERAYSLVEQATSMHEKMDAMAIAHKYDQLLSKYLFADVQQVDVTSGGEKMGVQLVFTPKELDDWKQD